MEWVVAIRTDPKILSSVFEELKQEAPGVLYPEALDAAVLDAEFDAEGDEGKANRILAERLDQRGNPTFHKFVQAESIEYLAQALGRLLREELEEWHRRDQAER